MATSVSTSAKLSDAVHGELSRLIEATSRKEGNGVSFSQSVIAVAVVVFLVWAWFSSTVRKSWPQLPPGPRGLPLLGALPFLEPNIHGWLARLARKYGPIISFPLGRKLFVVVSSAAAAKHVHKDQDAVFANRDVPAASMALLSGSYGMGWAPYGAQWRMLRRLCMGEMLSSTRVDAADAADVRRRAVSEMLAKIVAGTGAPVNVGKVMFEVMYKVITGMLWGGPLGDEKRRQVAAEFQEVVEYLTGIFCKPDVSDFYPALARFDLGAVCRMTKKGGAKLEEILDSLIDRRRKTGVSPAGNRDFLESLLQIQEAGDPKTPLTVSHIKGLLMDLVLAGNDTTWTTMEWAMTEMMQHPEMMAKAQKELDTVVGKNHTVEETHLPRLPYLHAFIKEVLRLHPVVPLMLPRTPSESAVVAGYWVPQGSRVLVNMWAIHRDPEAWESPEEFRPERFLADGGRRGLTGNDFHYFPFGSGRRICPGMALAEKMLMHVMASLLHSFDWRLPEGEALDVSEKFGIVLKKARPLMAVATPRFSDLELYALDGN